MFFNVLRALGVPLGPVFGGAQAPRFVYPLAATEISVRGRIIVPTVMEGFANISFEIGETLCVRPGFGETLEQRRSLVDVELSTILADLMAKGEVIRAGHLHQTTPAPLPARRS